MKERKAKTKTKTKTRRTRRGGLKFNKNYRDHRIESASVVAMSMFANQSAKVRPISTNSLMGFILRGDFPDSSFYTLVKTHGSMDFSEKVHDMIFKVCIVNNNPKEIDLPAYYDPMNKIDIPKVTENKTTFLEEACLQQRIWMKSVLHGRLQICPSVATIVMAQAEDARRLLQLMYYAQPNSITDYLLRLNMDYPTIADVGIIVMPTVPGAIVIEDYLDNASVSEENKWKAVGWVIAQYIRLFIDFGVIHFDLHQRNALVCRLQDQSLQDGFDYCLLIDFSRASDITKDTDDKFMQVHTTKDEKHRFSKMTWRDMKNKYLKEFRELESDPYTKPKEMIGYISRVLKLLMRTDYHTNQAEYNAWKDDAQTIKDTTIFQTKWIDDYLRGLSDKDKFTIFHYAFTRLKKMFTPSPMMITNREMMEMTKNKYLFEYDASKIDPKRYEVHVTSSDTPDYHSLPISPDLMQQFETVELTKHLPPIPKKEDKKEVLVVNLSLDEDDEDEKENEKVATEEPTLKKPKLSSSEGGRKRTKSRRIGRTKTN